MEHLSIRKGSRVTPRFLPLFPREAGKLTTAGIITQDREFTVSSIRKNGRRNPRIITLVGKKGFEYDESSFTLVS